MNILEVRDSRSVETVAALAHEIWNEYYPFLIGQAQVDYMLRTLQSKTAIQHQIDVENFLYYLMYAESGEAVGYVAVVVQSVTDELFLSKIYVKKEVRGRGYGKRVIDFLENLARQKGLHRITLMVSKKNKDAIAAYLRMGFKNGGPVVKDIGNGFVMDDYRMEKVLVFLKND